jgi:AraC-like DNA-binding protein
MPAVPRHRREDYHREPLLAPALVHLGWAHPRSAAESGLGPHRHDGAWELCFIQRGGVEWWVGDETWEVPAGSCYLTRPDELHGGVHSQLEPCELFWLGLRADSLPEIEADLGAARRVFPGTRAIPGLWWDLLVQHRTPDAPHAALAAQGALLRLLAEISRCARSAPARAAVSAGIARAQAFAAERLADDPPVAAMARAAGLAPSRFHARFLDETGESPAEWVRRLRLDRAKRLLATGERPVTDIAFDLGYPTSQYFATVFRRYTGLTPRQYRERTGSTAT